MNVRDEQPLQLPEELRRKFTVLERRLWAVDTAIAVSGALGGLLVSYALLFISDRFWDTPPWMRFALTLAGLIVVAYFVLGWVRVWLWHRRDTRALANVVQSHHRRLGDRLLGIVELADVTKRPADVSPALCRAAIAQVSAEAIRFDFRDAVATRKPRLYALGAVFLFLLVLTPWLLAPAAGWNALTRWLRPTSDVPRFTFVSLEQLPPLLIVPHGEPFEVVSSVAFHHLWKPSSASAQYEEQEPVRAAVLANQVLFRLPGQTKPGDLTLRVGDIRRVIRVEPHFRPALKTMVARVSMPDYLQHLPADAAVLNGTLSFVEGSKAIFTGTVNRALTQADVRWINAETNELSHGSVPVESDRFRTASMLLDGLAQSSFTWRDVLGLSNAAPWTLSLQSQTDAAPEVDCPSQAGVVAMLVDEVIEISALARDDYGLRDLGVAWQCEKRQGSNIVAQQETVIAQGSPQATNLTAIFRFAPTLLKLPEESLVTLHATATDYKPGRPRTQSSSYRIYILGHEEHAQLVQQQFEKVLAEVEELTRREEALAEETRETKESTAKDLASEETAGKLQEQASEQAAVAEKTARVAREAGEVVREAMRNKTIPTEMLKEWTQHVETMQKLAQEQMPQAAQSLSKAQQSQQNPSEREQKLNEAAAQEKEIVEKLQNLQKQMGPALDRMMANTLAHRLRKVAKFQEEVGQSLQKVLPETIGLLPKDLPPKHASLTARLTAGQEKSGQEAQQLEEEITRFFHRTSVTNYGSVSQEMKETKVVETLSSSTEMIRQNISAQAMQEAGKLAGQFSDWAKRLENSKDSSGQSAEGNSGSNPDEAALERLLALLRVRQGEVNLRQHTQVLDQIKNGRSSYLEDSVILSVRQSLLVDDVNELVEQDPGKFLGETKKVMGEAQNLLQKPQTDAPTIAAETDAVNLLEAEIMSMVDNQQGKGQAQSAAMAMLMQMMGMNGKGQQPGQNFAGGDTDRVSGPITGNTTGDADRARETEKTAGRDVRPVPVEYREALQSYRKAIEKFSQ